MKVHIPPPLHSYTANVSLVESSGATLDELLRNLDAAFPGIRFRMIDEQGRIRRHIKLCVNTEIADSLLTAVPHGAEVQIICAISGG
jgi:molybdopterin converting factor small subunit